VVGNRGHHNYVYFNDGSGEVSGPRPFGTPDGLTYDVAVGDFDGDGRPDIAVANSGGRNAVYLNAPAAP
jgi:hypothetical protein